VDQVLPEAPEDLIMELSGRYITLFERITGQSIELNDREDIEQRILENIEDWVQL